MCDAEQLARMGRARVNRRDFAKLGGLAAVAAAVAPDGVALAQATMNEVAAKFDAPGGRMDGYFVHPPQGRSPAVIVWPDAVGLRDSFMAMARRLARQKYAVLVLNPYYADAEAPQFDDFDAFREGGGMEKIGPWRAKLTRETVAGVTKAAIEWLEKQDSVDKGKGVAVQGYCMGGTFAVWTAAAAPDRVKAVATFHGGGMVTNAANPDDPDLAVKLLGETQASYLFAVARNDDRTAPGDKDALKAAAQAAGRPATVEVFKGDHGWMVDDSPAFDYDAADKAWGEMLDLYSKTL